MTHKKYKTMPKKAELNKISCHSTKVLSLIYFAIMLCIVCVYLGPITQQDKGRQWEILSHSFLMT
jgi:hypothetical protein